jgi:hypothetical protein
MTTSSSHLSILLFDVKASRKLPTAPLAPALFETTNKHFFTHSKTSFLAHTNYQHLQLISSHHKHFFHQAQHHISHATVLEQSPYYYPIPAVT